MSVSACCLKGFEWNGQPEGKVIPFPTASNQAYVTGSNPDVSIMLIHDLLSWNFINTRLLADHFAKEANATLYVPDFFGGESLPSAILSDESRWGELDIAGFTKKNSRDIREPEIFACARELRSKYKKVGAVGYCFGGWAVFRLGAKGNNLVDCIVTGHPTWLTKEDIDNVGVAVQVLAPEHDPVYTAELKEHTWKTVQRLGVPFDYQHFPGVRHACFTRGSPEQDGEQEAMVRGKNAAVAWFKQYLHG